MLDNPIIRFTAQMDDENLIELVWKIHKSVLELIPLCITSTKWRVPFYTYRKNLCYINRLGNAFYLGFMQGQMLADHSKLDKSRTTTIAKYHVKQEIDLRENAFFEILLDAIALQDNMYRKI